MPSRLRTTFSALCRDGRTALDITQRELASAVGVSRSLIAMIESGRATPTLDQVEGICAALGIEVHLETVRPRVIEPPGQADAMHARMSAMIGRRLTRAGWLVAREVPIVDRRWHGWIDLLAFDQRTGQLLIIEVKTQLADLGEVERQLGWYERRALPTAHDLGWHARSVTTILLGLASDEVERFVTGNRLAMASVFPTRATALDALIRDRIRPPTAGRGIALVDPASRRRRWLVPTKLDGRRTPLPYLDVRAALHSPERRGNSRLAGGPSAPESMRAGVKDVDRS